jgi:hypothetical protein
MMKYAIVVLILFPSIFDSCPFIKPITDTANEAIRVLEGGIQNINERSGDWQNILQGLTEKLPANVSSTIRNEVQNLATRSIAAAGVEFRCNTDFLAARAVQSLRRIIAELRNQTPDPLPPAFCQVAPDAIDLKDDPSTWSKITLSGYDLDNKDPHGKLLQIYLINAQGRKSTSPLPESKIGRTTHYMITLNMGDMARDLYQTQIVKLQVSWDDNTQGFPEIVVIPWEPHTMTKYAPASVTSYMPPHTGHGDRDFNVHDDEPFSVDVRGNIQIYQTYISSSVYLRCREERDDWTEAAGWSSASRVFDAPQGWRIVDVNPKADARYTGMINAQGGFNYYRPAGEVVSYFAVWGDHDGDEAGTWTRMEAHWRMLTIKLEETVPSWLR